jgi:hypothetical protein
MPKIQWERLPKEKWAHLRDRARERQISEEDLFELAEWKAQNLTCRTATGSRISERSSCVAPADIQVHFCWPDKPPGANGCDAWLPIRLWVHAYASGSVPSFRIVMYAS